MDNSTRKLTAFRLNNDEFAMLDALSHRAGVTRSAMIRLLIKRSFVRTEEAKK